MKHESYLFEGDVSSKPVMAMSLYPALKPEQVNAVGPEPVNTKLQRSRKWLINIIAAALFR